MGWAHHPRRSSSSAQVLALGPGGPSIDAIAVSTLAASSSQAAIASVPSSRWREVRESEHLHIARNRGALFPYHDPRACLGRASFWRRARPFPHKADPLPKSLRSPLGARHAGGYVEARYRQNSRNRSSPVPSCHCFWLFGAYIPDPARLGTWHISAAPINYNSRPRLRRAPPWICG